VVEPYTLDVPRRDDPYPYYAMLRREEPVHYSPVEDIWVLTRFADCLGAFSDPQLWSSQRRGNLLNDLPERVGRTVGTTDPPRHTFARRLVNKAFTPRTVAGLEPLIRKVSAERHDEACAKGRFEYVHDISAPLNARILGAMFGVPEAEFLRVRAWLDDFFVRDKPEPGREPRQVVAMRELRGYVDTLVAARVAQPGDDVMSAMLGAREDGDALSHDQVAVTTMTFLTAGFESTNNLFTNMVRALALHPATHAALRADPTLVVAFTEEAMRWDAAAQGFVRTPTRDVDLDGTVVPEGAQVLVHIGAANRDPAAFSEPDRFDLTRFESDRGGRHLGLGHGAHFCIGGPLARVLARVAVEDLVARADAVHVDETTAVRVATPNFRGFQRLDVAVG
jgi:cytochrome P450